MKLADAVKIKEFFSIERMKNKNFISFLFSVVLCITTLILADGDQSIETRVPNKQLQNSSLESSQDHLLKASEVFQPRENVTEEVTEEISEFVTETLPITTDINHESTDDQSSTEPMEDINQDVTTKFSVLPKRYAITPPSEELSETEFTFEQSYLAPLTLDQLASYSCIEEASTFGHKEATGVLLHEVTCELRKLWHYFMIAVQNLKNELQLELPIETEEAIILLSDFVMSGAIFDKIEEGIVHLEVLLENPENLNALLDTIEKCVPMSNIHETVNRLRIAVSNFFVHLQGFVIYFEPHQGIQNYIEWLKEWEEKLCVVAEKILDLFDIHLETEMHFLSEFASSVRLLLKKLSFEEDNEYNLTIFKEFIDTLSESFKQYHASESSKSAIIKLHTVISTFISTFLPQDFNIPILHFVLPNKDIATLSCIWQIMNETSGSLLIPSKENLTSIFNAQLLSVFEKEADLFSELSSLVKHLFEKLCSEQTFEEHLTILKDSIDHLLKICKMYLECSGSVIDKVHTFVSTLVSNLFSKDFNIPLLQFESTNGTALLSCIWQVTNASSSFPLLSPIFNVTSIVKDVTINRSKSLPGSTAQITASSASIQNTESSKLPLAVDKTLDVTSLISKKTVSVETNVPLQPSESIIQSPAPISNLLTPNGGSQKAISSITSAVNTIIRPNNYGSSEHAQPKSAATVQSTSATVPESTLVPSGVLSSSSNVKSNDKSESSSSTSLLLSSTIQKDSPHSDSSITRISNVSGITSSDLLTPFGTKAQNNQQPPVSSPSGKASDILSNNPTVLPSFENSPDISGIPSPVPKKPADILTNNPLISSLTPEKPTDLLTNNPAISSPNSEQPIDLLTTNPAIPSFVPEKLANLLADNFPIPSATPEKPDLLINNSPVSLSPLENQSLEKSADLVSNNPQILPASPAKPTNLLPNNAPIALVSPGKPTDLLSDNSPITTSDPTKPTDLGTNNPPIPFLVPGKPINLLTNTPQTSAPAPVNSPNLLTNNPPLPSLVPEKPADLLINNPPIPSTVSGEPVDSLTKNPAIPLPLPENPADLSSNNPPIPSPSFERPVDSSINNPPLSPFMFERPTDFSYNSPLVPSSSFVRPAEFSDYNRPIFASSPGRSIDFTVNNPLIPPYLLKRPVEFSNDVPVFLPSPRKSPSVLFLGEHDREVEKSYDEPFDPYTPPDYLIPASDIIPNLPRYQPLSNPYINYLESADAFYKSLYSYLQYGNPAIAPPPNVSNKILEFLTRGFPPSSPTSMDNPNTCGTSTSLPSLSGLNSILKNDIKLSRLPLYLPRKEIASALGNTILSPGDLIVILPKNGVGLIGQVIDTISPIYFKAYEVKTTFANSQDGIRIWHLRSGDFRNPECEQQLELLFQR